MTIKWGKLKPLDDYKTGLFPHNRWGMIYTLKGNRSWRCLSCLNTFEVLETGARSARKHYCVQEHAWRIYSGRPAPAAKALPPHLQEGMKPIEKVIVPKQKRPLMNRLFSWFGALLS
tara:strand:- start:45 stop:395 length:351 start_codon:yes stop_codon:yes gene_type:complete